MDEKIAIVHAVTCAVVAVSDYVAVGDARKFGSPPENTLTVKSDQFERALAEHANGWFVESIRCTIDTFINIVSLMQPIWFRVHGQQAPRPREIRMVKKIAICLHYLASGANITTSTKLFGVSHSSAVVAINQVLDLLSDMASTTIQDDLNAWSEISAAFQRICGFPGVVGAIDGTLIRVSRPAEYEGWYCRKGFPATNVQAVVNAQMRFVSCSIRAGSANDQSLWNRLSFRQRVLSTLPDELPSSR